MLWGPSPLVLYCELRQHVNTSRDARRAAPEKWQLFRAALDDRFGITINLHCVQMLPCIWRHLASTISAFDNSGILCWKTASRSSVEKLWQMETCRLENAKLAAITATAIWVQISCVCVYMFATQASKQPMSHSQQAEVAKGGR